MRTITTISAEAENHWNELNEMIFRLERRAEQNAENRASRARARKNMWLGIVTTAVICEIIAATIIFCANL